MKSVVVQAYVDSLRAVWIVLTALAVVAFAASLTWTAEISLSRTLKTDQGFVHDKVVAEKGKVTVDIEAVSSTESATEPSLQDPLAKV